MLQSVLLFAFYFVLLKLALAARRPLVFVIIGKSFCAALTQGGKTFILVNLATVFWSLEGIKS